MTYWDGQDIETYKLYQTLRDKEDIAGLTKLLPQIFREYPKMVEYILTTIDSCYGRHIVYVIDTNYGIKIGYTKNDVQRRFSEGRDEGFKDFKINEIIRMEEFQAKGAKDFESNLKKLLQPFGVKTNMKMPGKGEFYSTESLKTILSTYDTLKDIYKEIVGLKSPN